MVWNSYCYNYEYTSLLLGQTIVCPKNLLNMFAVMPQKWPKFAFKTFPKKKKMYNYNYFFYFISEEFKLND